MEFFRRYNFIAWLVILGLFTAGISPACDFVSGKTNLIEICTAFGVKTISSETGEEQNHQDHSRFSDQCLFCFSAHTGKIALTDVVALKAPMLVRRKTNFFDQTIRLSLGFSLYDATGPPLTS